MLEFLTMHFTYEPGHGNIAVIAYELKHNNKTCVTSKDTAQPVHPPSMARLLVYLSLNSLEALKGTCSQQ